MKRKTAREKKPLVRAADTAASRSKAPTKKEHQWKLAGTLVFLAILGIFFIWLRKSNHDIPSTLPRTSPSGVNIRWKQIAKKPRMYLTENFLSSEVTFEMKRTALLEYFEEADLLIEHCTKNLAAATVGEDRSAGSDLRNSSSDWCGQDEYEIPQVQDIIEVTSDA